MIFLECFFIHFFLFPLIFLRDELVYGKKYFSVLKSVIKMKAFTTYSVMLNQYGMSFKLYIYTSNHNGTIIMEETRCILEKILHEQRNKCYNK